MTQIGSLTDRTRVWRDALAATETRNLTVATAPSSANSTGSSDPVYVPTKVSTLFPRMASVTPKAIYAGHMSLVIHSDTDALFLFGNTRENYIDIELRVPDKCASRTTWMQEISCGRDHMIVLLKGEW